DLNLGQMSLHGCGLVRWHRKEDKGGNTVCGVEFVHLKPESIKALEHWLKKNSSSAFIPSPQISISMPSTAKLQSTG
ncbi:MAG: hypothetical protein AB7N80_11835, partial [Bdellovibrionales bacterium]